MSEQLSKLKSCPFCGSKALEVCEGGHYPIFRVECSMCECNLFGTFDIKDKVILAWNNRVQGLDQLSPDVEALAKELCEICCYPAPNPWDDEDRSVWRTRASILIDKMPQWLVIKREGRYV